VRRKLSITTACVVAAGALASPALAAPDGSALVETAQSKPVAAGAGKVRSVVGQAGITKRGKLVVQLAEVDGADGRVLARTSRRIDGVSRPADAKLGIRLRTNHTGTVTVIGPKNRIAPDSVAYRLAWNARKPSIRIAGAVPAAAAGSVQLTKVCGTGKDSHELVTRSGRRSSCRSALALMRGWRNKDNPRRYHGFRCGDVPGANVDFARGDRWFASWQCRDKTATYRVWTRY
jgi:hypothetical protein